MFLNISLILGVLVASSFWITCAISCLIVCRNKSPDAVKKADSPKRPGSTMWGTRLSCVWLYLVWLFHIGESPALIAL